jgi:DNA polymerase III subunit epsilon
LGRRGGSLRLRQRQDGGKGTGAPDLNRRNDVGRSGEGGQTVNFVAIDVETANADMASICQIGLVKCESGILSDEWKTYVDPEDYFDDINVSIHGIDESHIRGAPTFPELTDTLLSYLEGAIVVCHTHFDRVALHQAAQRYGLRVPESIWLDSARVARRTWKECAWKGYGLYNVCKIIGYGFRHHDALEDAKAAAHILLAATNESGFDIDGWLRRIRQPIDQAIKSEGNPEGALYGEVLVFTGTLEIARREAADLAASIGCQVESGVTKKTTMLVVGDQDIKKLAGHEKSSKHRKAEELIIHGTPIRIIKESDFKELVRLSEELR